MEIKIEGRCPMWNDIIFKLARSYWLKKVIFDEWKELAHWAIYTTENKPKLPLQNRVDIFVIAKYKTRARRDSDGVCVKPIIDALVASGVLTDDSTKYVRRVSVEAEIGTGKDEVIINLKEIV